MTKLWGALLWSLFLLLSLYLHGREEKRRLAEYRGLCRLVGFMKDALARAPEPLSSLYPRFSDDALSHAGFLSVLESEGLAPALASGVLHLDSTELRPFSDYAEGLGLRLYTDERAALDGLYSEVTAHLSQKEAAYPKAKRLSGTLFFTGGMFILLLLL